MPAISRDIYYQLLANTNASLALLQQSGIPPASIAEPIAQLGLFSHSLHAFVPELIAWSGANPAESGAAYQPQPQGSFDDAVLAAVRTSKKGASMDDLVAILADYRKTRQQIGSAIGRQIKGGRIERRDDLWFWNGDAATTGKKSRVVDRTLTQAAPETTGATETQADTEGTAANETSGTAANMAEGETERARAVG